MDWLIILLGLVLFLPPVMSAASASHANAPYRFVCGLILILLGAIGAANPALAADGPQIRIPNSSAQYRIRLEREAGATFGLDAPVARFAAQIHQESGWRPDAASIYAQGLAQFTPATATWLPDVCPAVGPPDAWDASWSIRALICYDHYLESRLDGATDCDRWSFVLSAYNGGLGWVNRDRNRASGKGLDPARWFEHVETQSSRAEWARLENRDYVRRILLTLEPAYVDAGWPGAAVCP